MTLSPMTGLLNAGDDRGIKLLDLIFTPSADNNELQLYEKSFYSHDRETTVPEDIRFAAASSDRSDPGETEPGGIGCPRSCQK